MRNKTSNTSILIKLIEYFVNIIICIVYVKHIYIKHKCFRAVSRHELFPIRAPLMYLEHCIAPFLNKCDANNDHMVTLEEWGNCLEIPKVSDIKLQ